MFIAQTVRDKKAEKVIVLDLRALSGFCEYFVICSGSSLRQVNALSDTVKNELAREGVRLLPGVSPADGSGWAALDFSSVVAHIFYTPTREFYALERLWSEAKRVRIPKKSVLQA
ncbi:MAG: ribosome silencing factor [Candidatus Omnitrophica bacterium]|nr:ribosome silencing factor [Candidatus Omnitrophota bacterium]